MIEKDNPFNSPGIAPSNPVPAPATAQPAAAPRAANVSSVTSTRAGVGHEETAVERIPKSTFHPYPRTHQVIMPYYVLKGATTPSDTTAMVNSWRLNSIYDCEATFTYSADPTAAADSADATLNQPYMRKFWMSIYQYWHVVRTNWRIRIRPTAGSLSGQITAYIYQHGLQNPPLKQTISGTDEYVPHVLRQYHPTLKAYKHIKSLPQRQAGSDGNESTYPNVHSFWHEFSGTWYEGQTEHEVVEDELYQVWHKADETPPTKEWLSVIVQQSPVNVEGTESKLAYIVEASLEYHVQLKDRKVIYEYITSGSDIAALTTFAAKTN